MQTFVSRHIRVAIRVFKQQEEEKEEEEKQK